MIAGGWADDSWHFRLIISAADGAVLGDLKPFIREVMADLERLFVSYHKNRDLAG